MRGCGSRSFGGFVLLVGCVCMIMGLSGGCVSDAGSSDGSEDQAVTGQEFVGTTPCDTRSREFVGGVATNSPCHSITWHLTLLTDRNGGTYSLVTTYGLPGRNDPNQIEPGPQMTLKGRWEADRGRKSDAGAMVYRLRSPDGQKSVSLARVGEHLLHFLAEDNSLMIGNAGWSYTLNRKGREN